jgi:hypothetical protein
MIISRRHFSKWAGATTVLSACSRYSFGSADSSLTLGLNTWSLRALSGDAAIPTIIQVMKETGLKDCQILFSHVEPPQFSPVFPVAGQSAPRVPPTSEELEKRRAIAAERSEWCLSVPMTYFESIRSRFEGEGLRIKSYSARLGGSEAEIDRLFLMTKALGAETIVLRIPEPLTKVVAAAADRHKIVVGLQFSDLKAMELQRTASNYFRLDPDIGDLTKAKINALEFIKENYKALAAIDLKDALSGGGSVPFGEGQSQMKEVLRFLQEKQVRITAYIDCDYPGTGESTEEVKRCIAYVRRYIT